MAKQYWNDPRNNSWLDGVPGQTSPVQDPNMGISERLVPGTLGLVILCRVTTTTTTTPARLSVYWPVRNRWVDNDMIYRSVAIVAEWRSSGIMGGPIDRSSYAPCFS